MAFIRQQINAWWYILGDVFWNTASLHRLLEGRPITNTNNKCGQFLNQTEFSYKVTIPKHCMKLYTPSLREFHICFVCVSCKLFKDEKGSQDGLTLETGRHTGCKISAWYLPQKTNCFSPQPREMFMVKIQITCVGSAGFAVPGQTFWNRIQNCRSADGLLRVADMCHKQ